MPLVAAVRAVDAGNSSVVALGVGGNFTGAWRHTVGMARVDITITLAATANVIVEHSDDGVAAEAALTETWAAAAAAHPCFPTPLPRSWYRVRVVDTGGGGALTLVSELDPRAVDSLRPIAPIVRIPILAAATVDTAIPLGARNYQLENARQVGLTATQIRHFACTAGAAQWGPINYSNAALGYNSNRQFVPKTLNDGATAPTIIRAIESIGANADFWLGFYP